MPIVFAKVFRAKTIFLSSCANHNHDGHYFTTFNSFGLSFAEINIDLRGNDVTVDNSLTGVSKFTCRQFEDRIEYEENNGTTRVMTFLPNGDLKLNDKIILKKTN